MSSQRTPSTTRRALLGGALASLLPDARAAAPMMRRIPSSGEALPVVGLGSWITFNVGNDTAPREACRSLDQFSLRSIGPACSRVYTVAHDSAIAAG